MTTATATPPAADPEPGSTAPDTSSSALHRIAAALMYRDFRILWFGAFTSTIGTWMQKVAQNWLVLTITGPKSAFFLGLDSFLGELPILLFTVLGGVVADRRDRRQMLLTSQVIQMASALILAGLVFAGQVRIWHVLTLSVVTGLAQAFGGPAYQSLLPLLVRKEHVPNAIAFNSIQFNLARVIGPLLAGGALAAFGMVACFGLNGLSFLAVIAAILMMRTRHTPPATGTRIGQELKSGVAYVRAHGSLMSLAALGFVATFLGNPILTFLPIFTQTVFRGDVNQYTQLMACAGAGAVSGALVVAWTGRSSHMGRTVLVLQVAFGLLILAFGSVRLFWLNAVLLFCAGACMVMVFSMLSSLVQLNAPNEMRGRVMSLYMVAFRGGTPLGSLVAGWLATLTSAPTVLRANGVLLSAIALWVLVRHRDLRQL